LGASCQRAARATVPIEREVRIAADSGRTLAGTWWLPDSSAALSAGASPAWPAVLLLSGSGPQDRDGARADLPGYALQREIADSLVHRGFAVLRLDDRGVGQSTGSFLGSTTYDFARDAELAAQWVRAQPMIDRSRLTLVGHSEGALVALLVAASDSNVRALVLLGAASRTGREVARWQRRALVAGDPATWPAQARDAVLAASDSNAERAAQQDPWLSTWFAIDPRGIARRLHIPALLLHGENDQQVPRAQADELAVALRDGGATDVSVRTFPSTNHLFLTDTNGDPRGYAQLASRAVRGDVLRAIAEWVSGRGRR
jgi:uncharacterized protein